MCKLYKRVLLIFLIGCSISPLSIVAQPGKADEGAHIYVYRPKTKSEDVFSIFFNRKKVFTMESGTRYTYTIASEGSLTVVCIVGSAFQEPNSKASNFRTLTIEKGKEYHFEASAKGELKYVLNPTLAKQTMEDNTKFVKPLAIVAEDPNDPIPSLSIEKKIVRFKEMVKKTQQDVAKKEREIKKKVEDYFADLKSKAKLAKEVNPNVNVALNEDGVYGGVMRYSLKASYSYEVDETGLRAELVHYPPGKYQLPTSYAAQATVSAMKQTIEEYLAEYIEPGSTVSIRITGSADATPIQNKYFYEGEYNESIEGRYYIANDYGAAPKRFEVDSTKTKTKSEDEYRSTPVFLENSTENALSFKRGDRITQNEQLALLRTMGIRYYMENDIKPLKSTKNSFIQRVKVEGTGSKFRKVVIELSIQDIFRNK